MSCYTDVDPYPPGKFEASGPLGEKLYELSLDGGLEDELGDNSMGETWYGLLLDTGLACAPFAILSEDSQGFVEYGAYDTKEKVMRDWERIQSAEAL